MEQVALRWMKTNVIVFVHSRSANESDCVKKKIFSTDLNFSCWLISWFMIHDRSYARSLNFAICFYNTARRRVELKTHLRMYRPFNIVI